MVNVKQATIGKAIPATTDPKAQANEDVNEGRSFPAELGSIAYPISNTEPPRIKRLDIILSKQTNDFKYDVNIVIKSSPDELSDVI